MSFEKAKDKDMTVRKTITLIAVLLLTMLQTVVPVLAEEVTYDSVTISGSHKIENKLSLHSGRHTFVLTAKNNAPMPEGSENGVKRVTINSNEDFSFGDINYTEPGTYEYTVSRDIAKTANLIQDDSVYKCKVAVFSDGTTVVVFEQDGVEGKPDKIEYTDTYKETPQKEPSKKNIIKRITKSVQTGDTSVLIYAGGIFAAAAILLLCISLKKGRNRK